MLITINRKKGNQITMLITRDNGSQTWTQVNPNLLPHEIGHYVVEKQLEFKNAFFGLINSGVDIHEFESHESRNANPLLQQLSEEALQTEHIVNLLQIEFLQQTDPDQLLPELTDILNIQGISFPEGLTNQKLSMIRQEYTQILENLLQSEEWDKYQFRLTL